MIIKIVNKNIKIELLHLDKFTSIQKYVVDEENYDYEIIASSEYVQIPRIVPSKVTTFYDMYELDGFKLQIQKTDGEITGAIRYEGNKVTIYNYQNTFVNEYLLSQYAMVYFITMNKAILFHGSSFVYKNHGFILTAKSGTGKSTHSRLWQKYENIVVVNDDKNIVRLDDGIPTIYPGPWSGKHQIDNNIITSLDAIIFLYQNPTNVIERLSPAKALKLLLGQLDLPKESNISFWDEITDKLLELPIYRLGCNMEKEAYETLKNRLEEDLCL